MTHLPLDLELTLSDSQIGALQAKANVIDMIERLNAIDCSDAAGNIITSMLFENRTKIISDIVNRFGELNELQKGYISSLFEFIEMNVDGGVDLEDWRPSLVTNEWQ